MNEHYLIIAAGWVIGQFAYACASVYVLQKNKNVGYWKAWSLYMGAEMGSFGMAFAGLLVILFIAGDYINIQITRADLLNKQTLTLKEKLIVFERSASVGIGAFIQHIIYAFFKKGKKKIEEYEKENNLQDKP